jgi:putative endonuclease
MNNSKKIGDYGEKIACYYLEKKGYKILAKNYSRKWKNGPQKGEIDIIAKSRRNIFGILSNKKEDTVHFIEVKTLSSINNNFLPEDKVDSRKQKQILRIAQDWLTEKKIPLESKWQIDVVSIKINLNRQKAKIHFLENIVSL